MAYQFLLTNNKSTFTIFLSSTSQDLFQHRNVLLQRLSRTGYSVISMEEFDSQSSDALDVSLKEIDKCNVFVGIYARRYGYIPLDAERNPNNLSITELEFRYAYQQGKQCLLFVVDDAFLSTQAHPIVLARDDIDTTGNITIHGIALERFLKFMGNKLVWDRFSDEADLSDLVLRSLSRLEGWRVPAHRFTEIYFVGRELSIERVSALLKKGHRVALLGSIGIGKSATAYQIIKELESHFIGGVLLCDGSQYPNNPELLLRITLQSWASYHHPGRLESSNSLTPEKMHYWLSNISLPLLVLIDNVETIESLTGLLSLVPANTPVLLTTRNPELAQVYNFQVEPITGLEKQDAINLLNFFGGETVSPKILARIADRTLGHPISLQLAGRLIRSQDVDYGDEKLYYEIDHNIRFGIQTDDQDNEVNAVIGVVYQNLSQWLQVLFRTLGVMFPGAVITQDLVISLWTTDHVTDEADANHALEVFRKRGLLRQFSHNGVTSYSVEPLIFAFATREIQSDEEFTTFFENYCNFLVNTYGPYVKAIDTPETSTRFYLDEFNTSVPHLIHIGNSLFHKLEQHLGKVDKYLGTKRLPPADIEVGNLLYSARHYSHPYITLAYKFSATFTPYALNHIELGNSAIEWLQLSVISTHELGLRNQYFIALYHLSLLNMDMGKTVEAQNLQSIVNQHAVLTEQQELEAINLNASGWRAYLAGEWLQAEVSYLQAIQIYQNIQKEPPAAFLNNLGELYRKIGRIDDSINLFLVSLDRTSAEENKVKRIPALNNLASAYSNKGDFERAYTLYNEALALAIELHIPHSIAMVLNGLAGLYFRHKNFDDAEKSSRQALALAEEFQDNTLLTSTLIMLADTLRAQGEPVSDVLPYYERAIGISPNKSTSADIINNIGAMWFGAGNPDKALGFYQQALTMSEEVQDNPGIAITLSNMGQTYLKLNQLDLGRQFLERAIPLLETYYEWSSLSQALLSACEICLKKNEVEDAQYYVDRVSRIAQQHNSPVLQMYALVSTARFCRENGMSSRALSLLHEGYQKQYLSSDSTINIVCTLELARTLHESDQITEAVRFYEEVLNLSRKYHNKYYIAVTQVNYSDLLRLLNRNEVAISAATEAIELLVLFDDEHALSNAYNNRGLAYAAMHKIEEALQDYRQCINIKAIINDTPGMGLANFNIAVAYGKVKNFAMMDLYNECAVKQYESVKDQSAIYTIYYSTARFLYEIHQYPYSLVYIQKAWDTANKLVDPEKLHESWTHIVMLSTEEDVETLVVETTQEVLQHNLPIEAELQIYFAFSLFLLERNREQEAVLPLSETISRMNLLRLDTLGNMPIEQIEKTRNILQNKNASNYFEEGEQHLKHFRFEEALTAFEQMHLLQPSLQSHLGQATAYFYLNKSINMLAHLEYIKRYEPNDIYGLHWQGAYHLLNNELEDALNWFTRAIEMRTINPAPKAERNQQFYRQIHPGMVGLQNRSSPSSRPRIEDTYLQRANANYLLNRFSDVIIDTTEALTWNINEPYTYQLRATAHEMLENYEAAVADLYLATELETHDHNLFAQRAMCFVKANKPYHSLDDFHWALLLNPRAEDIRLEYIQALIAIGSLDFALTQTENIVNFYSQKIYWTFVIYILQEHFERALETIEIFLECETIDPEGFERYKDDFYLWRIRLCIAQQRYTDIHQTSNAISHDSMRVFETTMWKTIAYAITQNQNIDESLQHLRIRDGNETAYKRQQTWIAFLLGEIDSAKRYYRSILENPSICLLIRFDIWILRVLETMMQNHNGINELSSWLHQQLDDLMEVDRNE